MFADGLVTGWCWPGTVAEPTPDEHECVVRVKLIEVRIDSVACFCEVNEETCHVHAARCVVSPAPVNDAYAVLRMPG